MDSKLTINNLEKLKYSQIYGYEVREVHRPTTAPDGTTYNIHAFNPKLSYTSLFIDIYRDSISNGCVKVRFVLVGVVNMELRLNIPLSKFADMNEWVGEVNKLLSNGGWKQQSLQWT
jgi:hypothetical protein